MAQYHNNGTFTTFTAFKLLLLNREKGMCCTIDKTQHIPQLFGPLLPQVCSLA